MVKDSHYINNTEEEEKLIEVTSDGPEEDSWLWSWKAPTWLTSSKASDIILEEIEDPSSKLSQEGRL